MCLWTRRGLGWAAGRLHGRLHGPLPSRAALAKQSAAGPLAPQSPAPPAASALTRCHQSTLFRLLAPNVPPCEQVQALLRTHWLWKRWMRELQQAADREAAAAEAAASRADSGLRAKAAAAGAAGAAGGSPLASPKGQSPPVAQP